MKLGSYGAASAALTVGGSPISSIQGVQISGILCVATGAGNAVLQLIGGQSVTVSLAVGTVVLPLAVSKVVSQTATATYYALG